MEERPTELCWYNKGLVAADAPALRNVLKSKAVAQVDELWLGGNKLGGMGGLVLIKPTPDANLGQFLDGTAFEMGGYVNTRLISTWQVTYAPASGKVYISTP